MRKGGKHAFSTRSFASKRDCHFGLRGISLSIPSNSTVIDSSKVKFFAGGAFLSSLLQVLVIATDAIRPSYRDQSNTDKGISQYCTSEIEQADCEYGRNLSPRQMYIDHHPCANLGSRASSDSSSANYDRAQAFIGASIARS